jgi:hypothetical protein
MNKNLSVKRFHTKALRFTEGTKEESEINPSSSFVSFVYLRELCVSLLFITVFALLISCENPSNPFKAGLGHIVDIRPPTIELLTPEVDTFIRGEVTFIGVAEDDYKLDRVEIKITNFPDLEENPWSDWTHVKLKAYNSLSNSEKDLLDQKARKLGAENLKDMLEKRGSRLDDVWSATVDTVGKDILSPIFPDGDFKIRIKAVDSVGKWAGDEDIVFQLKNRPPKVSLTLPSVTEGGKDGEAGSQKLNFGWAGSFPGTGAFPSVRILDTGAVITGMIRDNEGVVLETAAASLGDGGPEKYAPQFRFWRVNPNPQNINDPGGFLPGYYPTETEVTWEEFVYEGSGTSTSNLMEIGANEYLFMHKIPNESDRYYGFEIRVQSKDGTEFHYPKDFLTPDWWNSASAEAKRENQYVLFYARLPQEYPTLDLYQFQNIFGEGAWNSNATPPRYEDIPGIDINSYHPYVNSTAVFKNGSFILRLKASHSRFVDEARVFWERSDKTAKGLFIWDPADQTPFPGWNANNNISTARPYEQWGYYDTHQSDTRNFIFTYNNDPAKDTLPVDGISSFAAGRYKVQRYIGLDADWKNDKDPSNWADYTNPQNGKSLEEGTYDISGETVNGNSLISKYLCTITLDSEGPEVTLNGVEGSLDDGSPDGSKPYTVNGVVRPGFRIFDSRARDSGLRLAASDYYKRDNGRMGDELRYMLISAGDKTKMDTYFGEAHWNGNPWPPLPDVAPGTSYETLYKTIFEKTTTALIPGITVYKQGPILDGSLMFKATKIYGAGTTEDVLADGDYLLYAFARDNAFNVSWESFPILVNAASDIPGIDFIPDGAISEEVTDPSVSADKTDSATGNGFVVGDGNGGTITRNKFGTNTTLRMRLSDDDSVNLGDERIIRTPPEAAGASGITVTVTGARYADTTGNVITAYTGTDYEMRLTEADILSVFRGQQLDGETRRPVRERTGTINQFILLEKIKGNHLTSGHPILTDPLHPYNLMFGTVSGDTPAQIKAKKDLYQSSSLPEGIYRITVTVQDYRPAKLRLPWETDPVSASRTKTIWIAVDSTGPTIDRESILPKEGTFLAADAQGSGEIITGKVFDKNGPVTVKSFTVNSGSTTRTLNPQDITFRNIKVTDGVWEAEFSAPINLGGSTGAFTFTFEFQDRFGNANPPFPIRYSADVEPPAVGLFSMIRTFERDQEDVILRDPYGTISPSPLPSENKVRLTNGVVSFEISASDNSGKVEGLRWWLLPASKGSAAGLSALNSTGLVTDYNAYPFTETTPKGTVTYLPSGGAYGEINMDNRPYRVRLDTAKLHTYSPPGDPDKYLGGDGEYRLHVIGIDEPGNVSRNPLNADYRPGTCILQEIYVLQEQDRPYFFDFAPASENDVVDSLVITGTIYEDHGFTGTGTPPALLPETVRIWLSNADALGDLEGFLLETSSANTLTGYDGPKIVRTSDLTLMGKNIGVKINLSDPDYFGSNISNGPKSYIIEAKDSNYTKFTETGAAAGEGARRSRRQHYSFAYDNKDPVIALNYPASGTPFGLTADPDFRLEGYIEDAYLKLSANGFYYIKYRLDDAPTFDIWELRTTATGYVSEGPSPVPGNGTRVNFNIPANRVTGTNGMFNFSALPPGSHTLTLMVEDQSRKDHSVLLTFIKDVLPPEIEFTNINERRVSDQFLPQTTIGNWWDRGSIPELAWNNAKRNWLISNPVSTIYYDTGVPELTGTFRDETSDIDPASFRYLIDGDAATGWTLATNPNVRTGVLDGTGRNVRWTVYLTENGLPNGKPLSDGVHTIRITIADTSGNVLNPNPNASSTYMFAFRIVSSGLPKATIESTTGDGNTVFGNSTGFTTNPVFTIYGTAENPNLKDLRLRIVETTNRNTVLLDTFLVNPATPDPNIDDVEWSYPSPNEKITWSYLINKNLYDTIGDGKSFDVIAVAVNHAGTESEEAVWTFTKDMGRPVITFAGTANTNTNDLNPTQLHSINNSYEVIRTSTLKLQGGVTDGISRINALEYKIWKWNYGTGAWDLQTPIPAPPAANYGWANMPDFNSATNTSSDINWTIESPLTDYTEGLYRIKVQARDASYIRNPANERIPTFGITQGDFSPGGIGNPVTSGFMYFFYDRSGPAGFDPDVDNFYSSRAYNGTIPFSGEVDDPNRVKSVTVKVIDGPNGVVPPVMTAQPWTPANENQGTGPAAWNLTLNVPFNGAVPDGRYRLEFTATDMALNSVTVTRTFTLDNTPPEGEIIYPERRVPAVTGHPEASIIVTGGKDAEITGTTADKSANRAESGVDAMWYHLGYLNTANINYPTDAQLAAMPEAQRIATVRDRYTNYFNANEALVRSSVVGAGNTDTGKTYNADFDARAQRTDGDNAWFKYALTYGAGTRYPVPTGFIISRTSTVNIYDWRMEIPNEHLDSLETPGNESTLGTRGGLKQYASRIQVKGKWYNGPGDLSRMVVPVHELIAGQAGIYSLPLWLRVVDNAGNVSYSCRDIWIYPDGDIPSTSILNPQTAGLDNARGGSISADGVAQNITSIYSVIYRVKADDNRNNDTVPDNTKIVIFDNGATEIMPNNTSDTPEYDGYPTPRFGGMPAGYKYQYPQNFNPYPVDHPEYALRAGHTGWYRANLEVARGEPIAPWNFLFNTADEITSLIPNEGFESTLGSGKKDTIRVYMEVFVFSGDSEPVRISIANGTADTPEPYVRTFYLKTGAPQISVPMISTVGNSSTYRDASGAIQNATRYQGDNIPGTSTAINYEPYRSRMDPRRGRFYVRAELSAADSQVLNQISVRRQNEADSGYQTAWQGNILGGIPGVTITPATAQRNHVIRYAFDSTVTASTNEFGAVMNGAWRTTGGTYGMEIRIRDNSNPPGEASYLLELGIDNFAPVADPNHTSPKKAAGTAVDFIGRVFDYQGSPNTNDGMPRKVDKVYVWFTKTINGQTNYVNFVNLDANGAFTIQPATGNSGTRNDIFLDRTATVTKNGDRVESVTIPANGTGTLGTVTFPRTGATGETFNVAGGWVKEISETESGPGTDKTWIPTNLWDIQWVFRTDTTKMPDGEIALNYVVFDSAGNASFYRQEGIFIRNKYPEISRVTLYTDNNGVGAVYTTHDTNSVASTEFELRDGDGNLRYDNSEGYLNSGFISKNRFIGFRVETLLGNAPLSYRLQYVTRELVPLNEATLQRMVTDRNTGVNLYTIAEHGDYSNNNWATIGVNISNPPVGTHFVFPLDSAIPQLPRSESAKVWRYTAVRFRDVVQPGTTNGNNNPVLPNESNVAQEPGHGFNFNSTRNGGDFDPNTVWNTPTPARIGEFNGSHPDDETLNKPEQTAFFLIKVWDSVNPNPGANERDQLFDAVVIGMNVYLTDRDRPTARLYDLNPYAETAVTGNNIGETNQQTTRNNAMNPRGIGENILRGGLYNTGTAREIVKSGHIEPRNGTKALLPLVKTAGTTTYVELPADGYWAGDTSLPAGAIDRLADSPNNTYSTGGNVLLDQVSGKVILRGVAWDNQLIREIRVQIGTGAVTPILRLDLAGDRTMKPVGNVQAAAREELHWKTGHTVEWAYIWDTETLPNADGRPATGVAVSVSAIDELSTGNLASTSYSVTQEDSTTIAAYSATATYNSGSTVRYDGVNYYCIVQSVSGGLPPSENTSAWTRLFHNTANVDIVPYISGFARDTRFTTKRSRQGWYSFYQGENNIKAQGFNLGTGSGTTMSLYSNNNTTATTLNVTAQNKNSVTFTVPDTARSGKIVLNVNGTLEALNHRTGYTTQSWNREYHPFTDGSDLWLNKPYAHVWRSNHQTSAPATFFGNNTAAGGSIALQRPAMALEYTGGNSGRLTGAWAIYATAGVYWGYTNATRSQLYHNNGEPYAGTDISFYNGATANGSIVLTLEDDGNPRLILRNGTNFATATESSVSQTNPARPTNQWMHNRVSRSANQSHISSYDAYNRRLYYSRGTTRMNIDGPGADVTGGIAASTNAGMYSAIDYDSTGPVIAYYDTANDTIRLAYASTEAPAAANWTRRNVLPNDHSLFLGSGAYVSIKVDKGNNIHLAFYNSQYGTVVYAVGTRTGTFTAYTIDNVIKGGAWTNISVDDSGTTGTVANPGTPGNPTIVYADSARTGNYDGMRLAYKSSGTAAFAGSLRCPVTNADITGCEAMTVAANYQVNDDRLNVEAWPPTNRAGGALGTAPGWNAAVGYASKSVAGLDEGMFRLAYFYNPGWKDY